VGRQVVEEVAPEAVATTRGRSPLKSFVLAQGPEPSTSAAEGPEGRTGGALPVERSFKAAISLANFTFRPPRHPRFLFGGASGKDGTAGAAGVSLSDETEDDAALLSIFDLIRLDFPIYFHKYLFQNFRSTIRFEDFREMRTNLARFQRRRTAHAQKSEFSILIGRKSTPAIETTKYS
jgi:hypothetical protein